jgi:hypothetical protein
MTPTIYPPVGTGECIYCNVPAELCVLDEEHIIPKCLGGNITLLEASCTGCGAITGAFERQCAADIFESLRAERGLRGRRRKRWTHLPVLEEFPPEINDPPAPRKLAKFETPVPVRDYPTTFVLPVFEEPGLLLGKEPSREYQNVRLSLFQVSDIDARVRRLMESGLKGANLYQEMRMYQFVRMLAKIAHAFAMAEYGAQIFEPLLLPIILSNDPFGSYLVGGARGLSVIEDRWMHRVHTELCDYPQGRLILAHIRLFGDLSPTIPVYTVVVGRLPERKLRGPLGLI